MTIKHMFGTGYANATSNTTGTTFTGNKPANAAVGMTAFAFVYGQGGGSISAVPTGWTIVGTGLTPRTGGLYFYRITDATALTNFQASPAWTGTVSGRWQVIEWLAYGISPGTILDVQGAEVTSGTTSVAYATITPKDHSSVVYCTYSNQGAQGVVFGMPSGVTDGFQADINNGASSWSSTDVAYINDIGVSAAVGAKSLTINPASTVAGGLIFAISAFPAGGAPYSAAAVLDTPTSQVALSGTRAWNSGNVLASWSRSGVLRKDDQALTSGAWPSSGQGWPRILQR